MIKVIARYKQESSEHISQILCGLTMLKKKNIIEFKIEYIYENKYGNEHFVEVEIDGKIVVFDISDGDSTSRDKYYHDCDFVFKRSYDKKLERASYMEEKIRSLGLNYYVTCKDNPYDKFYFDLAIPFLKLMKLLIKKTLIKSPFKRHTLASMTIDEISYKQSKKYDEDLDLIFLTRLWFPYDKVKTTSEIESIISKDVNLKKLYQLDKLRVEVIKGLKENFGDRAVVGLAATNGIEKFYPDLIVSHDITSRLSYLNLVKRSKICITSNGLHDSIGWKFGEYVALGKVILTENLVYDIPYDFIEGKNYLTYLNVNDCVDKVNLLLSNSQLRQYIKKNNIKYYDNFLSPDNLVLNAFNFCNV